jgi:carbonic anhydrase/acetyltransferase-like protein (isoleucine patch superfamily)
MAIYELDGVCPELPADGDYWIADTAAVIGRVRLLPGASVWFGAVLRGDTEWIEVGPGSNVQDGATIHTDAGFPTTIGVNCTIGHQTILHGCTIADNALIGMGSIVLNGAQIARNCLVGAHALISENKSFPENQLIMGVPAKAVRSLDEAAVRRITLSAEGYRANARRFKERLVRIA